MIRREFWRLLMIHFKELIREPGVIFWGVGFPVLMAWGLGLAFTESPDNRRDIGVLDPGQGSELMEFLGKNAELSWTGDSLRSYNLSVNDSVFGRNTFRFIPVGQELMLKSIKRGRFDLVVEEMNESLYYHMDPANPDARLLYLQITTLFDRWNNKHVLSEGNVLPFQVRGTRYIDFLIPGLIAMGIMMSCMWGVSYTIIERRKGLMLRRMIATPMRKYNLLMAHMTARVSLNFLEAVVLIVFAWLYFNMDLQGSWLALLLVFITGNMAFTGLAVLFSSRTSKTEIGNAIINVVTMPMLILSGIFFSYQNFPEWSIPYIEKLPLSMLADGIRGIFNEGAGLQDVMENALWMGGIGLIAFIAGLRVFKWY